MRGSGDGFVHCSDGQMRWGLYGAAGVVFVTGAEDGPLVMLQLRSGWSHEGGTWSCPGGALELGEDVLEGALREASEEVGVPVDVSTREPDGLTIGQLSTRTGVAPSALRFYEAEGLIHAERTSGGQRRYHRDVLRRVSFMRIAQQVGLSLQEIRDALATLPESRTPTRADWERLSASWRSRLDARIALMERLRDDLSGCIGCGCLSLQVCPLYNPDDVLAAKGPGAHILLGDAD
jgi:MerR family redox-sensitive transcriptional activator SoxR